MTPDKPDNSLSVVEKHNLEFNVLTDTDNNLARQFGIVYPVEGEIGELYKKFGIDLMADHNSDKAELPLAATYVIDSRGKIRYAFVDVDYTRRADPELILQTLRAI